MTARIPLSVLDLSPIPSGGTAADGLRRTISQARHVEELGYARYWLAEHHLNPGVAGAAPHVLLSALAGATSRIRLGTAATILGNSTPLRVVEELGLIASLHPERIELGIGRSGARPPGSGRAPDSGTVEAGGAEARGEREDRVVDGLVVPAPRLSGLDRPRFAAQARLLGRAVDAGDRFDQDVRDILALIDGVYAAPEGVPIHAVPAEGSGLEVWIHGSSAGPSARLAGELGLPFGANYHVLPSFVLEAVAEYRRSFRPGRIPAPQVIVSADVLVAPSRDEAEHLALGYGQWVHSIRAGQGAIPYLAPQEARDAPLDAGAQASVQDRLDTRFVGSPSHVAEQLRILQRATGADELLLTTIAHDQDAQLRSFTLLAEEWSL